MILTFGLHACSHGEPEKAGHVFQVRYFVKRSTLTRGLDAHRAKLALPAGAVKHLGL